MFELDPRLAADTHPVGRFALSRLVLMDDRRCPWFLLVPERVGAREIFQLSPADQALLGQESLNLAAALSHAFRPDKLNIATLGNLVPQLHVHHIARFRDDALWPGPVWGRGPAVPYDALGRDAARSALLPYLAGFVREGW